MFFLNIALGLIGLGIVVFVHELGHFLAARLGGIEVEAFSIGWGNPLLKKKIGNVEIIRHTAIYEEPQNHDFQD